LTSWPDDNLPLPRQPVGSQDYLHKIQLRLLRERVIAQRNGAAVNAAVDADTQIAVEDLEPVLEPAPAPAMVGELVDS
jgi:hypothetical protein